MKTNHIGNRFLSLLFLITFTSLHCFAQEPSDVNFYATNYEMIKAFDSGIEDVVVSNSVNKDKFYQNRRRYR